MGFGSRSFSCLVVFHRCPLSSDEKNTSSSAFFAPLAKRAVMF